MDKYRSTITYYLIALKWLTLCVLSHDSRRPETSRHQLSFSIVGCYLLSAVIVTEEPATAVNIRSKPTSPDDAVVENHNASCGREDLCKSCKG